MQSFDPEPAVQLWLGDCLRWVNMQRKREYKKGRDSKGGDFVHNEEHQLLDCHSLYDIESESEDESVSVLLYLIVGKVILIKMDLACN